MMNLAWRDHVTMAPASNEEHFDRFTRCIVLASCRRCLTCLRVNAGIEAEGQSRLWIFARTASWSSLTTSLCLRHCHHQMFTSCCHSICHPRSHSASERRIKSRLHRPKGALMRARDSHSLVSKICRLTAFDTLVQSLFAGLRGFYP